MSALRVIWKKQKAGAPSGAPATQIRSVRIFYQDDSPFAAAKLTQN
jgi:hypothetical protein